MKKKSIIVCLRVLSVTAIAILSATGLFMSGTIKAHSEEHPDIATEGEMLEDQLDEEKSTESLLSGYLYEKAGINTTRKSLDFAGNNLSGMSKAMYEYVKKEVAKVAVGQRTSTSFSATPESLGYSKKYYASDLGVSQIVVSNTITTQAQSAMTKCINYNPEQVIDAILSDSPYEMYWSNLRYNYNYSGYVARYDYDKGEYYLIANGAVTISFAVSADYTNGSTYEINTSKIASVNTAVNTAKNIVNQAGGKTDYDKLVYYRDKIIELVDYNDDAAEGRYHADYGNPWQLIWVFDGDPATKVVCEGYSKAFAYLCEMTKFDHKNIYCILATGQALFNGNGGNHMWNIMHMDDGCNYLVDVTNCDNGGSSVDDWLFILNPTSGLPNTNYVFKKTGITDIYMYDSDMKRLYTTAQLTLSSHEYASGHSIEEDIPSPVNPTGTISPKPSNNPSPTVSGDPSVTPSKKPEVVPSERPYIPDIDTSDADQVRSFVKRLYVILLGRSAEEAGLNDWTNQLKSGSAEASQIVKGIANSDEFKNKNYSYSEMVERMYLSMLNRESDVDGKQGWVDKCENGMSVNAIINGFSGSNEFGKLCASYGIKAGTISLTEPRDQNEGITSFIARCYTKALGRSFDVAGINDWCGRILASNNKRQMALDIASNGFFHSPEFISKNTSNEDYVDILYRTFLGREADSAGRDDWVGQLNKGVSRDQVMSGFSGSIEFDSIMKSYGL